MVPGVPARDPVVVFINQAAEGPDSHAKPRPSNMTEAELIENVFKIFDRYWSIIQWWSSVSFGFIAVAHFAIDKLTKVLVLLLIALYLLFSAWVAHFYFFNVEILVGFRQDLAELGDLAHHGTKALLSSAIIQRGIILQDISIVLTFAGAIGYMIYAFSIHHKSSQLVNVQNSSTNP